MAYVNYSLESVQAGLLSGNILLTVALTLVFIWKQEMRVSWNILEYAFSTSVKSSSKWVWISGILWCSSFLGSPTISCKDNEICS